MTRSVPPLVTILFFVGSAILVAQSTSQDYPQWRGRNRDGAASAFVAPATWPEKLTRRWTAAVGEGYATPLVVGTSVYVFTRQGNDEAMIALDSATGRPVWRTAYPAPDQVADPAKPHGLGPKATPLFHNGRLFTMGNSGIVSAFDATSGQLLWQKPGPPQNPIYGAAVSPLGDGGIVVVHVGDEGPLTALDAATGAVKWTWSAGGGPGYGSPMMGTLAGERQLIVLTQKCIAGLTIEDGTLLWQYPTNSEVPGSITPIIFNDTVIVSGQALGVTALRPVRRDGKWQVEMSWQTKEIALDLSNPVLIGETLYGLSARASGQFFALDAKSGKVLWLGQPREANNTAIVSAGDLVFLLNDDGELIVAKSSRSGFEAVKRYAVADRATWAQPAISGGRILVKDVGSLTLWTLN